MSNVLDRQHLLHIFRQNSLIDISQETNILLRKPVFGSKKKKKNQPQALTRPRLGDPQMTQVIRYAFVFGKVGEVGLLDLQPGLGPALGGVADLLLLRQVRPAEPVLGLCLAPQVLHHLAFHLPRDLPRAPMLPDPLLPGNAFAQQHEGEEHGGKLSHLERREPSKRLKTIFDKDRTPQTFTLLVWTTFTGWIVVFFFFFSSTVPLKSVFLYNSTTLCNCWNKAGCSIIGKQSKSEEAMQVQEKKPTKYKYKYYLMLIILLLRNVQYSNIHNTIRHFAAS